MAFLSGPPANTLTKKDGGCSPHVRSRQSPTGIQLFFVYNNKLQSSFRKLKVVTQMYVYSY